MRCKFLLVLSAATMLLTGPVVASAQHRYHPRGYHSYGVGPNYRARGCARANSKYFSEPANMRVQDRDFQETLGDATCF